MTIDNNLVYHYTSHKAAKSIIQNAELWLTNIRFMNDEREFYWVYDRLLEIIESRKNSGNPVHQSITDDISILPNNKRGISICVIGFSYKPDDVAQWVQYATNGEGVCIGFNVAELIKLVEKKHHVIGAVEYNVDSINIQIEQAINSLENEVKNTGRHSLRTINDPIAKIAILSKNPTFKSEEEFRIALLGVPYTRYEFFSRSDSLIPYIKLPITYDCITTICLGPKAAKESENAWELFLSKLGGGKVLSGIQIRRSKSSLR